MNTVLVGKDDIDTIVPVLLAGDVVAFPTETVFGLGVKFNDLNALNKIYQLKHRDSHKAVTLMVHDINDIEKYAYIDNQINNVIKHFMPGKITLILKKKEVIDDVFTSGLKTIGIRIPDDPFVLELLKQVGPMFVTSANISGHSDLLNHQDVYSVFKGKIKMIVKGDCGNEIPSTVVKLDQEVQVLRKGHISKQDIEEVYYEDCNRM